MDIVPLKVEEGGRIIFICEALKFVEPNEAMMFCPKLRPTALERTMFPPPPALVRAWEILMMVPGFHTIEPPRHVRFPVMDVVSLMVKLPETRDTDPLPRAVAFLTIREPA